MDLEDLRQFARRDWQGVERAKRAYWADEYRRAGPDAARRASTLLLAHAQRLHAGFPSEADRAVDVSHHRAVCDRLDRAARAFSRR